MGENEFTLTVNTAEWYTNYVDEMKQATLKAIEKGVPEDIALDNFESSVRSAAFDAVKIEK